MIDFLADHGYPPTVREIGAFFNIKSTNGVSDHLRALERKGYVSRSDGQSRGLTIHKGVDGRQPVRIVTRQVAGTTDDDGMLDVPVLGRVAAGVPLLAVENIDGRLRIDPAMVGGRSKVFGLRVVGHSMIEDGILDGDLVLVASQNHADNGRTVVALIDDEVTVKRFYRELGGIRLQPANRSMKPIFIDRDDPGGCAVLGEVVGVFRQLG